MTDFICSACKKRIAAQRKGIARVMKQSKQAKALRAAGWLISSIATHLDVTHARVYKLLQPGGVFDRTKVDAVEIQRLRAHGVSAIDIAKQVKCSPTTVYRALSASGG